MFNARYITPEERETIKANKQKEKDIRNYQYDAIRKNKSAESSWKLKNYRDKY